MKKRDAADTQIGERVRRRRLELGLTQQKLSGLMRMSYQQLQEYEHGTNRISRSTLRRLSEVLGVEPRYFFAELTRPRGSRGVEGGAEPAPHGHSDREMLELVKAYSQIANTDVRDAVRLIVRSFAKYGHRPRTR